MRVAIPLALVCLFCLDVRGADEEQLRQDEAALRAIGVTPDGPGLLDFIRKHTTTEADETSIKQLVRDMGDERFRTREKATFQLTTLGSRVIPFLQAATTDTDLEISRRAQRCLTQIEQGTSEGLIATAARLIALKKPAGAERVLLDYLGGAEKEPLIGATVEALAAVARPEGKTSPTLVEALADKNARRRAAAGVALVQAEAKDTLPAVRKLLADPQAKVRLDVGLALVQAKENEALPVLIRLLGDLPANDTGVVEDLLYRIAGEKAPTVASGTTPEERKKYRDTWLIWHGENKDKIDLAKLSDEGKLRGHTLVVLLDLGRVMDLDEKKRERFRIDGLDFPLDAQYLPGDRVLIAEYQGNRVSERSTKGEVLWEKKVTQPIAAQRLPNGNTFIATPLQLMEVDRSGKEVWTQAPPNGGRIMKATRLRSGDTAIITLLGVARFSQLDKAGKEVRGFGVEQRTSGGRIDVLPNGNVLLTERDTNRVIEVDSKGKTIWQVTIDQPVAAVRLPNGNTLITTYNQMRAVEVDRKGKEVWEYKGESRVTRAWRH